MKYMYLYLKLLVIDSLFQTPAIVDSDGSSEFDLLTCNEIVHESEVSKPQSIVIFYMLL